MVLLHAMHPVELRHYFTTHAPTFSTRLHLAVHPILRAERDGSGRPHGEDDHMARGLTRSVPTSGTHRPALAPPRAVRLRAHDNAAPRQVYRAWPASEARHGASRTTLAAGSAAPFATRITRSHQRIELTEASRPALRVTQVAREPIGRTPDRGGSAASAEAIGSLARSEPDASRVPAEIDIEQLTNDVVARLDNRLTAHRERLGRAF